MKEREDTSWLQEHEVGEGRVWCRGIKGHTVLTTTTTTITITPHLLWPSTSVIVKAVAIKEGLQPQPLINGWKPQHITVVPSALTPRPVTNHPQIATSATSADLWWCKMNKPHKETVWILKRLLAMWISSASHEHNDGFLCFRIRWGFVFHELLHFISSWWERD